MLPTTKIFHFRCSILFGLLALSAACSEPPLVPESTIQERLQQALDSGFATCDGYGASAAVLVPGHDTWLGTSGVSHDTVTVQTDMIFSIASVSKAFTATLIFLLEEDGLLSLDDSLHRWLPPYPHVDSTITIRQLLGHTSGVFGYDSHPDFWDTMGADMARVWTPEELLETFMDEPHSAPGSEFYYTNTNYLLLGMIVEASTGSPFAAALRDRVLDPLGLDHTFVMIDEAVVGDLVHPWWDVDRDGEVDDMMDYPREAFFSMGGHSMVSTAGDLLRFSQALFEGDLIGSVSLNQMLNFHPVGNYGLGLHRWDLLPDTEIVGHRGGTPLTDATMAYLPDHNIHFAVVLNWRAYECNASVSTALLRVALE